MIFAPPATHSELNIEKATHRQLEQCALAHIQRAYAPYSNFRVGAALATVGNPGQIFGGCNVENASYGATICAERAALLCAVAHGERSFAALVVASEIEAPVPPCGLCLQVLSEFCADLEIILINSAGVRHKTHLRQLLGHPFDREYLLRDSPKQDGQ